MREVWVIRDLFFDKQASLGTCLVYDEFKERLFKGASLERGWVDNKNNISCIPTGNYLLRLEWSPKFKTTLWEIYGVDGRSECKFHSANYWWQLNGCIALGRHEKKIDGDAIMDVAYSNDTMKKFHEAMKGHTEATLKVRNLNDLLI